MRQECGYAILQMPAGLLTSYDASMRAHQAWPLYQRLCKMLARLPRSGYRGISRFMLKPLPSTDADVLREFESTGCDVRTDYAARLCFLKKIGDVPQEGDFDEDLLPNLGTATEVFAHLESPERWEILQLNRDSFCTSPECLGFDVGYWGGDHFSILCDSAVMPLWHPPQPDTFRELAKQLARVNEHFLFGSAEEAAAFRAWYRTQENWAETEMRTDEFCIIQVSRPARR